MGADEDKDVTPDSSADLDKDKGTVEDPNPNPNDKDKNFAEIRKQLKDKEDEIERLKKLNAELEGGNRSFTVGDDEEDKGKKSDKRSDAEKVAFERDMKDAVREWNRSKKVSNEEWAQIQSKVSFKGTELRSEIIEKITEAHESLPSYKQAREKQVRDEAKKEAMREFQDSELDLGGGGDVNMGGDGEPRTNSKEKRWLDAFGVSKDDRKKIDRDKETNVWEEGKQPTRKFFVPKSE